jgi:hypothetical protein
MTTNPCCFIGPTKHFVTGKSAVSISELMVTAFLCELGNLHSKKVPVAINTKGLKK